MLLGYTVQPALRPLPWMASMPKRRGMPSRDWQLVGFFAREHVQEGTYLALAYARCEFGVAQALVGSVDILVGRALVRGDIAGTDVLAHLPYLLFQCHLLQEELSALLRGEGRVLPVAFAAAGGEQHGRNEEYLFHQNCTFTLVFW